MSSVAKKGPGEKPWTGLGKTRVVVVLPVDDAPRAAEFYRDKLGLTTDEVEGLSGYVSVKAGEGTEILLRPQPDTRAPRLVETWFVVDDDLDRVVRELTSVGVEFPEYSPQADGQTGAVKLGDTTPSLNLRTISFGDTEGNVIRLWRGHHPEE